MLISFNNRRICLPNIKQASSLHSYSRLLGLLHSGTRLSILLPANVFCK